METSLYNRIQRYIFPYIDSNMYILAENGEALVIDPHISSEADRYLKENHVGKVTIVLTHEHFDHICGVPWFREHYNTNVICQQEAVDPKRQKHFCRPLVVSLVLADRGEYDKIKKLEEEYPAVGLLTAERTYEEEAEISWQGHTIHMEHLPGHSPGSSLVTMDGTCVFTGDSLIPGVETTLRWPFSDAKIYRERAAPRLLQIAEKCMICPGHRDMVKMSSLVYRQNIFCIE